MLHIIIGPPCAGKSTYLQDHAKAGDLKVDFDKIARTLGAEESHDADGIIKTAAFAARDAIIKVAIDNPDEESWIIHTQPTDDQMKAYKDAGSDIIVLDPAKTNAWHGPSETNGLSVRSTPSTDGTPERKGEICCTRQSNLTLSPYQIRAS